MNPGAYRAARDNLAIGTMDQMINDLDSLPLIVTHEFTLSLEDRRAFRIVNADGSPVPTAEGMALIVLGFPEFNDAEVDARRGNDGN